MIQTQLKQVEQIERERLQIKADEKGVRIFQSFGVILVIVGISVITIPRFVPSYCYAIIFPTILLPLIIYQLKYLKDITKIHKKQDLETTKQLIRKNSEIKKIIESENSKLEQLVKDLKDLQDRIVEVQNEVETRKMKP